MSYKHKRSSVTGNIPAAGVLQPGEIAVNFADKSLYTENTSGVVVELARDVYKSSPAPTSPTAGDIWYDTANNVAKIWNSSTWATLGGGATLTEGTSAAKAALTGMKDGDLFYVTGDTTVSENDRTYVYSTTSLQWIEITGSVQSNLDLRYVQRAGDIMVAGATIELGADPVNAMDAVTLQYLQQNSSQVTVASSAPLSPAVGDIWVNNTSSPSITNVWNGTSWEAISGTSSTISDFQEAVQDVVGGFVYGGNNVTVSYNDANNSVTVSSKNSTLAAAAPATAQTGDIWFNTSNNQLSYYNAGWQPFKVDSANVVFASTAGLTSTNVKSALDELKTSLNEFPETIQDTIGAALVAGNNVNIIYNDPAGTITITADNVVKTVNGAGPDAAGNVTITMGQVYSGTLANLGAGGSAAAVEGDNYVVQGDATPANNGKMFIYDGVNWLEVGMIPPPKAYIGPTATPPATPWAVGDLWWNSDKGILLIYYNDGTSSQWVPATPSSLASTGATFAITSQGVGAPTSSAATNSGQLYVDTATNEVYYSDGVVWTKTAGGGGGGIAATDQITFANTITFSNTIFVNALSANGSLGTAGQVLTTTGTDTYWANTKWTDTGANIYRNSNVAIGSTTAPTTALFVTGDTTVTANLVVDTSTLVVDAVNNRVGIGNTAPTTTLFVTGDATVTANLVVDTNSLFVNATLNRVGIGTASPAARLDVGPGSAAQEVLAMPALNMDLSLAQMFTKTATAGSYTFSNVPTGRGVVVVLHLTNGGAVAITWPSTVGTSKVYWPGGTAPTLTAAGTDVLTFVTHDGGITWRGNIFGKDIK